MPDFARPAVVASIVIQVLDTGQVELHGAIENPIFAIGVLELARFKLLMDTREPSAIVTPGGM